MIDKFTALADPTRRRMLDLLRGGERPAGYLGRAAPGTSQPGISRHLRALRDAGLVSVRGDEQRRLYSINSEGFAEFDAWVARYRAFWPARLDALGRQLGETASKKGKS